MDTDELAQRKRRLSPKLLALHGVSGVGLASDKILIYLADESEDVQARARAIVDAHEPGTPVAFEVTGPFRKQ